MRVGIGYDIHRLVEGRKLVLGGVQIDHPTGLLGHSDGDVLLHALCDALLGAAGGGDIGDHFSDKDPQWKDVASNVLLQHVLEMPTLQKMTVSNLDANIFAEEPKLGPLKRQIRAHIAKLLSISEDNVNIKAKTMEAIGPIGEVKAIAAQVIVALEEKSSC